jgi:membrane-bound ClpP family serine protease
LIGKTGIALTDIGATGGSALIGKTGIALTDIGTGGMVNVFGESWKACSDEGVIPANTEVRVTGIKGLTLHVTAELNEAESV